MRLTLNTLNNGTNYNDQKCGQQGIAQQEEIRPKTAGSAEDRTRARLPQTYGQRLRTASPSKPEPHEVLDEWMWRARLWRAAPIEGGNKERGVVRRSNPQIGDTCEQVR